MGDSYSCFISLPELQVIVEANLLKMYQNGITKESMGESIALRAQVKSRLQKNRLENGYKSSLHVKAFL